MKHVAILICLLVLISSVAASAAQIKITADNFYDVWLNPSFDTNGSTIAGYLGTNNNGDSGPSNWSTPETYNLSLIEGVNTILVKAQNAGAWTSGNPAALLAIIQSGNQTLSVTNASWQYSLDYNPATGTGTWVTPSVAISSWDGGAWKNYASNLSSAFNGSSAEWIWSSTTDQASPVWFRTNVSVPEPMSIILGVMGLASITGFRKFRK